MSSRWHSNKGYLYTVELLTVPDIFSLDMSLTARRDFWILILPPLLNNKCNQDGGEDVTSTVIGSQQLCNNVMA